MGCCTSSSTTDTPHVVEGRWCWTAWATPSEYYQSLEHGKQVDTFVQAPLLEMFGTISEAKRLHSPSSFRTVEGKDPSSAEALQEADAAPALRGRGTRDEGQWDEALLILLVHIVEEITQVPFTGCYAAGR